jgi:CheY-specific phosphatase CheX
MTAGGMASWLADLEGSVEEIATSALGLAGLAVTTRHEKPPHLHGAYLGLVGPAGGIQIGLAATPEGCQALAKGLMGMAPEDPALSEAETADAMCEIVNIVAGAFKTRLRDRAHPLQMGLPVFIHGAVLSTDHVAVRVAEVALGAIPAAVLLVHPRQAEGG